MLLLLAALFPVAVAAAEPLSAAAQQEIERLVSQEMSRQGIPGLSVAVGVGGEAAWSAGYGFSDMENFVPAKALTQYRTGSIAKPVTAVAVMQMVEAGKMDLDAPVHRYVPAFPRKQWPITIRQLLGHLGGIRHYSSAEETNSTHHFRDTAGGMRLFLNDPLVAEPGTKYNYTTYGYVLLGAALEQAAGIRYMEAIRQRILIPAGMDHTRDDHVFALIPNRSRGYVLTANGLQNCSLADTSNKIPGGGLISTAEDLVRFGLGVRSAALLKQSSVDLMFTPLRTRDGKSTGYGLGWGVANLDGRKVVRHAGGQQGVSTMLSMLPRENLVVAIMTNLEKAQLTDLSQNVLRSLTGARAQQPVRTVPAARKAALTPGRARPIL